MMNVEMKKDVCTTACVRICVLIVIRGDPDESNVREPSPIERSVLAELKVLHQESVPLVIAAKSGGTEAVRRSVESVGGTVVASRPEIDYLYATVPMEALDSILPSPDIVAVQVAINPVRSDLAEPNSGTPHIKQESR